MTHEHTVLRIDSPGNIPGLTANHDDVAHRSRSEGLIERTPIINTIIRNCAMFDNIEGRFGTAN